MGILNNQSKVLLPTWLLQQQHTMDEKAFMEQVKIYLKRYPDYSLLRVVNRMAVCERPEISKGGRRNG